MAIGPGGQPVIKVLGVVPTAAFHAQGADIRPADGRGHGLGLGLGTRATGGGNPQQGQPGEPGGGGMTSGETTAPPEPERSPTGGAPTSPPATPVRSANGSAR